MSSNYPGYPPHKTFHDGYKRQLSDATQQLSGRRSHCARSGPAESDGRRSDLPHPHRRPETGQASERLIFLSIINRKKLFRYSFDKVIPFTKENPYVSQNETQALFALRVLCHDPAGRHHHGLGIIGLINTSNNTDALVNQVLDAESAVKTCRIETNVAARDLREMLLTNDTARIAELKENINSSMESITEQIAVFKKAPRYIRWPGRSV